MLNEELPYVERELLNANMEFKFENFLLTKIDHWQSLEMRDFGERSRIDKEI